MGGLFKRKGCRLKKEQNKEEAYGLEVKITGVMIPLAMITLGILLYVLTTVKLFALFLITVGILSIIVVVPALTLKQLGEIFEGDEINKDIERREKIKRIRERFEEKERGKET